LNKDHDLTQGSVLKVLIRFALPFLFSNFMQALYGAVDLMVVGQFSGVSAISAVNIGSQIMQIVTCFIIGISMGVTVKLAHAVGCRDDRYAARIAGSTFVLFALLALAGTPLMLWQAENMAALLHTPAEAMTETVQYVRICSAGLPFIIAFNVIAGLLRGLGDSKTPMYFVGIACGVNVAGDLLLVSVFGMGVAGAALATTAAQFVSSAGGALYLVRHKFPFGFSWKNVRLDRAAVRGITAVGLPIAMQDTLINISFILLTVIANGRGLVASSAVGVVEKLMMFMFLVPDAMLSSISTITAQNVGAGKPERAVQSVKLGMEIQNIQSAVAGVKRIDEFLVEPEREMPDDSNAEKSSDAVPIVRFDHVRFGYGEDSDVLRNLSFTVSRGEAVTFVGRTGAGKSTVFRLLLGLYRPLEGRVLIEGSGASGIPDEKKRRLIGYVEQSFHLVEGTVAEQISLFDPAVARKQVENAAKLVGLHESILALPDGYDTPASEAAFSQGQFQLLSIARAIAASPEILLLDEITANLDSDTEQRVLDALERAAKGRTVLSISHRLQEHVNGQRIIRIGGQL
jgi:putative MATE family efflux protein